MTSDMISNDTLGVISNNWLDRCNSSMAVKAICFQCAISRWYSYLWSLMADWKCINVHSHKAPSYMSQTICVSLINGIIESVIFALEMLNLPDKNYD